MRQYFKTDGIRGEANKFPLTPEQVVKFGKAIGLFFKEKKHKSEVKIVVAQDTRISGDMIKGALTSGLCSVGTDVLDAGVLTTPGLAYLVRDLRADAGIVISASHNPFYDNGIKVFNAQGHKLKDEDEEQIESLIGKDEFAERGHIGRVSLVRDAEQRYINFLESTTGNISLNGFKIVLDCANGASYRIGPQLLRNLGAEVIVLNDKPNGLNINQDCGALHPEELAKRVAYEKADMGIALDGDADRVVLVDEHGKIMDGDDILFMISSHLKKKNCLKANTVIATAMSNFGFEKALNDLNIKLVRTKVGDKYVAEEMRRIGASIGGEQSGHIILGDYFTTGDGLLTTVQVLKILREEEKPLSYFAGLIKKTPQILVNVPVKMKVPLESLKEFSQNLTLFKNKIQGKGRIVVRYSGTQNLLRIMVEHEDKSFMNEIADKLSRIADKEINC